MIDPPPFQSRLRFALDALSISRVQLAAELGLDKSVVGRWLTGAAKPSAHNLARLTSLLAARAPGFALLDWEAEEVDFAARFGRPGPAGEGGVGATRTSAAAGLPLAIMDLVRTGSALRGKAYEGFFRSTRPYVLRPGLFLHDHGMLRMDEDGLLSLRMGTGGTSVKGYMMPLHNQLFCVAADVTSGALLFGLFNGVAAPKAQVLDGLVLGPSLDAGRTPTAYAMMFERIGDLSGDAKVDDARIENLMNGDPVAPPGSVPESVQAHLLRDIGPAAAALGGDLLLRMPLDRSISSGAPYSP